MASIEARGMSRPLDPDFGRYVPDRGLIINGFESHPLFNAFDNHDKKRARSTAGALNSAGRHGYIDLSKAKKIVDFGTGKGVPALVLLGLAELNCGTVQGLELERFKSDSVERGIIDPRQLHVGDGLRFLDDMANRGKSCDLITAFMLGPESEGELARRLFVSASRALSSNGHLVVTSDGMTIRAAEKVLNNERIAYVNDFGTLITSFEAASH